MNKTVRNTLGVVFGVVIGSNVNMFLINISSSIIPPPEGADVTTMEGLLEALPRFEAKHYLMPFLAHGLGTLVGAFISAIVATNRRMQFALGIGAFFLLGGIINAFTLPSPAWFIAVDLIGAYITMALIGWKLATFVRSDSDQNEQVNTPRNT
jgi:hypothetical protein